MANSVQKHDCLEHLDASCQCTICGSSNHFVVDDDNGAGSGRVNEACLRCGKTAACYADSAAYLYNEMDGKNYSHYGGISVSKEEVANKLRPGHDCKKYVEPDGTCLLCGKRRYYLAKNADKTRYAVKRDGDDYLISGFTRIGDTDEQDVCKLAVTVVPFIASGKDHGKFIVYDTLPLKRATGSPDCTTLTCEIPHMFCFADPSALDLIGKPVPQYLCRLFASHAVESRIEQRVTEERYKDGKLLPIGFATNTEHGGDIVNYIFAMPMKEIDITSKLPFVVIESFIDEKYGIKRGVVLTFQPYSETELRSLFESCSDQVSKTISDLWLPENEAVYGKLLEIIENYGG
ncbi:hypothetical protein LJC63_02070 [Ruminococcaceae bacterium OttesenSCG-928-L11]|nr:hypothetical protein [Ruminococcaceae bacterium OttesenSCG-928-L11]